MPPRDLPRLPMKLRERPCGALMVGSLPEGCRLCERGEKLVLFAPGLCASHCFYCPVSEEKMYRDVVFANERRVERDEDLLEEARAMRATGAGITGGDPLEVADRVAHYIRLLKDEFGEDFHTHLYTMTADLERIRVVADGGLDEIRFHPPPGMWARLEASGFPAAAAEARRPAETVAQPWDVVTEDGTILKGIVETDDLDSVERALLSEHGVPKRLIGAVPERRRVEVAPWILETLAGEREGPAHPGA